MSIKCRSCGFINPDDKKICENCGCDLRYSSIFEKMLEREKESESLLFDIEIQDKKEDREDILIDTSEEEVLETEYNIDEEYKPVSFPDPEKEKKKKITKQIEDNERSIRLIGKTIAIEFLEFCLFFMFFLIILKVVFNKISFSNTDIAIVSLLFYLLFNLHSFVLTGKPLKEIFEKRKGEN